jgi:hypothetical protein
MLLQSVILICSVAAESLDPSGSSRLHVAVNRRAQRSLSVSPSSSDLMDKMISLEDRLLTADSLTATSISRTYTIDQHSQQISELRRSTQAYTIERIAQCGESKRHCSGSHLSS